MKTATIRDLRYEFGKIERWLKRGESVQITRHSKPIGVVSPPVVEAVNGKALPPLPDFAARRKRIFGDRVFTQAEVDEARRLSDGY